MRDMPKTNKVQERPTVKVTVTLDMRKDVYEEFTRLFDATSQQEWFNWATNDLTKHLVWEAPEHLHEWLESQRERQRKEAETKKIKPQILFTLTGEQAREHIENGNILSCTTYTKAEDGEDKVEFYLSG